MSRFVGSNTGNMGSNPTPGMDVCVRLFCVCVVLCVGSGLATGWSPVQGVPPTVYRLRNWKSGQNQTKGCRVTEGERWGGQRKRCLYRTSFPSLLPKILEILISLSRMVCHTFTPELPIIFICPFHSEFLLCECSISVCLSDSVPYLWIYFRFQCFGVNLIPLDEDRTNGELLQTE
jgi:hypothetical protein